MTLPRLYKKTKTGALQVWDISTEEDAIKVSFGQLDGKMQTKITPCFSKNVGKANETTPQQQAELEAKAKHTKQLKAGYVLDESGELAVKLPMKISTYEKSKHNLDFSGGVYDSDKLNGLNGTYRLVDGEIHLLSRGGERYPVISSHIAEVAEVLAALGTDELNGELYLHTKEDGTRYHLQELTSLVRKHTEESELLEFHVFDAPNLSGSYKERYDKLLSIIK